ncbi:MAG: Fe-S cluster assembly protein SufD [Anaerolineales bacterium]|nr:Fe-S cluster assembly protein SufD [Anaerolineales bacterium]
MDSSERELAIGMSARKVIRRKSKPKPEAAVELPFNEEDVRRISSSLEEPSWLLEQRLNAWRQYQSIAMPSTKDEPWRRTDIRSMPSDQLVMGNGRGPSLDQEITQPLAGEAHGGLLVLQPGQDPVVEIDKSLINQGVIFANIDTAIREHPEILKRYLGTVVPQDAGKFSAAAAALSQYGFILYVPEGTQVEVPLHSILWAPSDGSAIFSRVLVVLDDQSSATYVHETASPTFPTGAAIHAGTVELLVGEGANLTFVELQNWGYHLWNFTHERALIERDGRIDWIFGAVGSHLTKNFTELTLAGQGAEGRMSGFYFADGDQHLDHDTQQNHLSPNTTSDLLFKGALLDQSRSVWQGMIYVAPGAQKTDGYQANRNLILSEKARADSIPGLEILADDVRCTHGATIGQLEEEPVYYLMSRGLPRDEAERLVIDGFFAPIMERIPFEGVRERFRSMIDDKLDLRNM